MSDALPDRTARFIDRHDLLRSAERVLVGVSGGPDSMVCLAVLRALGYEVAVLHVNYGLREGADADEALVRRYCRDHEIPLRVVALDAAHRAEARDESLQEAARALRYDALADVAEEAGLRSVAVGHQRDDQAETLLLNLLRGAGPEGLAGMSPIRPLREGSAIRLVRPFLNEPRMALQDYATAHDIPWRGDPTNEDPSFDRAALRTEILPQLDDRFPGARANIARAATLMREYTDHTLTPALAERMEEGYHATAHGGWVDLNALRTEPAVWQRRIVLEALHRTIPKAPQSYAVASELTALIEAQAGARVDFEEGRVWRERTRLRFVPNAAAAERVEPTPVPWGEAVPVASGTLRLDPLDAPPEDLASGTPNVEYVDLDRMTEPLTLRSWRAGDRLQPLGMDGTKRVSDLLTEAKVPPHRRAAVCVLTTENHVAWVVGHRLAHPVRVRPDTRRVARLTWQPQREDSDRENVSDDCNSS